MGINPLTQLWGFTIQVSNEPGVRYNISLINALVLYVGTQAIAQIHQKGQTPSTSTIAHSAHMDIFQNLAVDLDTEGEMLELLLSYNYVCYRYNGRFGLYSIDCQYHPIVEFPRDMLLDLFCLVLSLIPLLSRLLSSYNGNEILHINH